MISIRVLRLSVGLLSFIVGLMVVAVFVGGLNDVWVIHYTSVSQNNNGGLYIQDNNTYLHQVDIAHNLDVVFQDFVMPRSNLLNFVVAPNGQYAFMLFSEEPLRLSSILMDLQTGTIVEFEGFMNSWSPDSRHVVYSIDDAVFLVDVTRLEEDNWQMLENRSINQAWSPDGRYLLYTRLDDVENVVSLMMIDTRDNYTDYSLSTDDLPLIYAGAWSPDGQTVLVWNSIPSDLANDFPIPEDRYVYAVSIDVEQPEVTTITPVVEMGDHLSVALHWSEDSRYLLSIFTGNPLNELEAEIYDFETGETCLLLFPPEFGAGFVALAWVSDIRQWVWIDTEGEYYQIDPMTCESTNPRMVPAWINTQAFIWSPDHSQYVVSTNGGLTLIDANGNIVRRLSDNLRVRLLRPG